MSNHTEGMVPTASEAVSGRPSSQADEKEDICSEPCWIILATKGTLDNSAYACFRSGGCIFFPFHRPDLSKRPACRAGCLYKTQQGVVSFFLSLLTSVVS